MKLHSILTGAAIGLGLLFTSAHADVVRSEVTETTTYSGTVSEVTPSSRIVIKSNEGAPTSYTINKKTVFVDEKGNVVSVNEVQGRPVKVYVAERAEEPMVVERVVVSRPSTTTHVIEKKAPAERVLQRTETTTTTTHTEEED